MAEHDAEIIWSRNGASFTDNLYSRGHRWRFDGGLEVPASSSPAVVPLPLSVATAVDPEEAFVASLSSCHMLWFLSVAAKRGHVVDRYRDRAVGIMAMDSFGKLAMTHVTLRPEADFVGEKRPTADDVVAMHNEAHERCFIARSVRTEVRCDPVLIAVQRTDHHSGVATMKDLAITLENRLGALADMGEALGHSGLSVEGGGAWVVGDKGVAHFLVADGTAARHALETAGIQVLAERDVVVLRLKQDVPGQLGLLTRRMAAAGVNIEVLYSDHAHQLILVVDDLARGQEIAAAWIRESRS